MSVLALANSDSEIVDCFPVLSQLRPQLRAEEFLARVRRQQLNGYQLAFRRDADAVRAVGGFRLLENLAWGRFLYVVDLDTDADVTAPVASRL